MLAVPKAASLLASLLSDVYTARQAVKTLSSLSMDANGRQAISGIGNELENLSGLLAGKDRGSVQ